MASQYEKIINCKKHHIISLDIAKIVTYSASVLYLKKSFIKLIYTMGFIHGS